MTYSFSYLEPVCCSMSSSNSCFQTTGSYHITVVIRTRNRLTLLIVSSLQKSCQTAFKDLSIRMPNTIAQVLGSSDGTSLYNRCYRLNCVPPGFICSSPDFRNGRCISEYDCILKLLLFSHSVVSDSLRPRGLYPPGSSVHEILQARILKSVDPNPL